MCREQPAMPREVGRSAAAQCREGGPEGLQLR
jgi:hypothetical protein